MVKAARSLPDSFCFVLGTLYHHISQHTHESSHSLVNLLQGGGEGEGEGEGRREKGEGEGRGRGGGEGEGEG